jgi:hypothetical protein
MRPHDAIGRVVAPRNPLDDGLVVYRRSVNSHSPKSPGRTQRDDRCEVPRGPHDAIGRVVSPRNPGRTQRDDRSEVPMRPHDAIGRVVSPRNPLDDSRGGLSIDGQ